MMVFTREAQWQDSRPSVDVPLLLTRTVQRAGEAAHATCSVYESSFVVQRG